MEKEEDERDRQREKEEIEALRLEVMERQVKERKREREVRRALQCEHIDTVYNVFSSCCGQGEEREESTGSSSPQHGQEEDEDEEDVPKVVEMEEDIPLAKTGFTVPPAFAPIQVSPGCDHYSSYTIYKCTR